MGMFNILEMEFHCPKCLHTSKTEVEFKVGFLNLDKYKIGEKIVRRWETMKYPENSAPINGTFDEAGYLECPNCCQDYFLNIVIKDDIILKPEIKSFGWLKE